MVKGSLINQRVNDQSEYPDTNNPVMEGIDAGVAESWEGGNHDLALSRFLEIEHGEVTDIQGRLQACLSFWEHKLQPAPWIISCIRESYKLPLCSHFPSHTSSPTKLQHSLIGSL